MDKKQAQRMADDLRKAKRLADQVGSKAWTAGLIGDAKDLQEAVRILGKALAHMEAEVEFGEGA